MCVREFLKQSLTRYISLNVRENYGQKMSIDICVGISTNYTQNTYFQTFTCTIYNHYFNSI